MNTSNRNEDRTEPYVHILMINSVALFQIYCILNIFTNYIESIPSFTLDKIDSANFLLSLNIAGLVFLLTWNDKISVFEVKNLPFLFTIMKKLISFTQGASVFSGLVAVVSTIMLYFSEYRNLVIFKGKIVLLCVVILVVSLFTIFIYYRIKR